MGIDPILRDQTFVKKRAEEMLVHKSLVADVWVARVLRAHIPDIFRREALVLIHVKGGDLAKIDLSLRGCLDQKFVETHRGRTRREAQHVMPFSSHGFIVVGQNHGESLLAHLLFIRRDSKLDLIRFGIRAEHAQLGADKVWVEYGDETRLIGTVIDPASGIAVSAMNKILAEGSHGPCESLQNSEDQPAIFLP